MLDEATRSVIHKLKDKGYPIRQIARALGVSRGAVRRVLTRGNACVPLLEREEKAEPYREQILDLYVRCKGNLVRVYEELVEQGAELSYPALTGFCRRHGIGKKPRLPAGRYYFESGQEMQHDTSMHQATIGGKTRRVQTASLVLCYSRMLFFQLYPAFNRFYCKLFLTEGLSYLQGVCQVCMIDNTHVVVASGTGSEMVPVPEMEAFAHRFGFVFKAHEKGDANRSARVERSMSFIENNFLAGREFLDFSDLNQKAKDFCDKVNASPKRHLRCSPRELFAVEHPQMKPFPIFVPEVYQLHHRIVDIEGYVMVRSHRYSVPYTLIGKRVEVRETKDRIELFHGPRLVGSHQKSLASVPTRVFLPQHRPARGKGVWAKKIPPEEKELLALGEPVRSYVSALKKRVQGRYTSALRRLVSYLNDYPHHAFLEAVSTAAHYGLYDLERLERMILRCIAKEYFVIPELEKGQDDDR